MIESLCPSQGAATWGSGPLPEEKHNISPRGTWAVDGSPKIFLSPSSVLWEAGDIFA